MRNIFHVLLTGYLLISGCSDFGSGEYADIGNNIYIIDLNGSNEKRLTQEDSWFRSPQFTPDGKKIVYNGYDSNDFWDASIYIMNLDGSGRTWLAEGRDPVIAPDGQKILFLTSHMQDTSGNTVYFNGEQLTIMDIDGSHKKVLTVPENDTQYTSHRHPDFSPDGQKIVYVYIASYYGDYDYLETAIYSMNIDGSEKTILFNVSEDYVFPSFAGDGSKIVCNTGTRGEQYLLMYDLSQGTLVELTPIFNCYGLDVSPDGNRIIYESKSGLHREIFSINLNGTGKQRLTNYSSSDNRSPKFSPDGSRIVFVSGEEEDDFSNIMVMDADGKGLMNVTHSEYRRNENPSFSPDGQQIIFNAYY